MFEPRHPHCPDCQITLSFSCSQGDTGYRYICANCNGVFLYDQGRLATIRKGEEVIGSDATSQELGRMIWANTGVQL